MTRDLLRTSDRCQEIKAKTTKEKKDGCHRD